MAADQAATVTGPEQRLAGAVGGHVGRIGANVGGGDVLERAFGVVDLEGGDTVAAAHRNVEPISIGADELAAGGAGQFNLVLLFEGTGGTIEIIQHDFFVCARGDADDGSAGAVAADAGASDK